MKVGVLGAGQLGRMLALAGYPLGLEFVFYDADSQACAGQIGKLIVGEFDNKERLREFAKQVDVVTLEFENIPLQTLQYVAQFVPVYPDPDAVRLAQDRVIEKNYFRSLGIATPEFYAVNSAADLAEVTAGYSGTMIIKSRRFGYDGKGQRLFDNTSSVDELWESLGCVPLIAEQCVTFMRELSIVAARNKSGEICFYSVSENQHTCGILRQSRAKLQDPMQEQAQSYAAQVLNNLDYVGAIAFEFFDCDGQLLANEFAPRVHNSGHWTIEGAKTSQFENHLRAILDWPLGDAAVRTPCVMHNIVGVMPDMARILELSDVHIHHYGKAPRPGRKIGHITICNSQAQTQIVENILNSDVNTIRA